MASDKSCAPCSHCKHPEDERLLQKHDGLCLNCSNAGVPDLLGEIDELRALLDMYEGMKSGVSVRIAELEAELAELRAENDRLLAFLRSFLNPEERGHAVPAHVRDDVRQLLGRERVETTGEGPRDD